MEQQIDRRVAFVVAPEMTDTVLTMNGMDIPIADLLAVELWRIIGSSIRTIELLEHCGRIYLVKFEPHQRDDPILPVALVNLGTRYRYALGEYVQWLLVWNPWRDQERWSRRAERLLGAVFAALAGVAHLLTQRELNYIRVKLAMAAAMPE